MTTWHPFTETRRHELLQLLVAVPTDLETFVRARGALSGRAISLEALRSILDHDTAFAHACFTRIVPALFAHARALVEPANPTLELHRAGEPRRTTIGRADAAGWLAHLLLGTLTAPNEDHPTLDTTSIFDAVVPSQQAKLRCMLEYFGAVGSDSPKGQLVVERRVVAARSSDEWLADTTPLAPVAVDEDGSIEDIPGHVEVDFANRYLGGGVLGYGCVQEEIRFAVAPELLVAMIVSPRMRDDEAIVLHGSERFSRTRGYATSLEYAGRMLDPSPRAADGTPHTTIVAIDAVDYGRRDRRPQFEEAAMLRELGKARAGFGREAQQRPIATGNWGCGAFGGDLPLKAVLQWIAASSEGRALHYCTFGDARLGPLARFVERARPRIATVGELWRRLRACAADGDGVALYDRLLS